MLTISVILVLLMGAESCFLKPKARELREVLLVEEVEEVLVPPVEIFLRWFWGVRLGRF